MKVTKLGYPNPVHYDRETKKLAGEKLNRVAKELAEDIEFGDGYITWIGSELGTLRLYKAYDQKRTTQGYSENLKMFYFTLEF
jgi:hypothetical protein